MYNTSNNLQYSTRKPTTNSYTEKKILQVMRDKGIYNSELSLFNTYIDISGFKTDLIDAIKLCNINDSLRRKYKISQSNTGRKKSFPNNKIILYEFVSIIVNCLGKNKLTNLKYLSRTPLTMIETDHNIIINNIIEAFVGDKHYAGLLIGSIRFRGVIPTVSFVLQLNQIIDVQIRKQIIIKLIDSISQFERQDWSCLCNKIMTCSWYDNYIKLDPIGHFIVEIVAGRTNIRSNYAGINKILQEVSNNASLTIENLTTFPLEIIKNDYNRFLPWMGFIENIDKSRLLFIKLFKLCSKDPYGIHNKLIYTYTNSWLYYNQVPVDLNIIRLYIAHGLNMDYESIFCNVLKRRPLISKFLLENDYVNINSEYKGKSLIYYIIDEGISDVFNIALAKDIDLRVGINTKKGNYKNVWEYLENRLVNGPKSKKGQYLEYKFKLIQYILKQKCNVNFEEIIAKYFQ